MTKATTPPKRTLVGRVTSSKMDKIVIVLTENHVKHSLHGKYVVRSKKYHAHNEVNQYNKGDRAETTGLHPLSRTKSWVVSCLLGAVRVI